MAQLGNVKIEVIATAGDIDTATVIPKGQMFTHVGTSNALHDGVKLPVDNVGTVYMIRNDGANDIAVYPPNIHSNINDRGVGVSFIMTSASQNFFIVTGQDSVTPLGAGGIQYFTF
jgi:hypothetical protein